MMIPVIRSRWIPLKKADFEEDKHPRKNDGKFAPKGEDESNGQESASQKSETRNREETNKLIVKKPNGKAVSSGIKVKATGKLGKSVSHALTLIDKVHGDGELTHIPIEEGDSESEFGIFTEVDGKSAKITISSKGNHPIISTIHEIGHQITNEILLPENSPKFHELLGAIDNSKANQQLKDLALKAHFENKKDENAAELKKYVNYLMNFKECFGRSYAQYIVTKSGDKSATSELSELLAFKIPVQWQPKDFEPIETAYDKLFESKGWRK